MQWPLSVQPAPSSRLSLGTSRLQLPSFLPIQSPDSDSQRFITPQGSFPQLQDTSTLQTQRHGPPNFPVPFGLNRYTTPSTISDLVSQYNQQHPKVPSIDQQIASEKLPPSKTYTAKDFQYLPPITTKAGQPVSSIPLPRQGSTGYLNPFGAPGDAINELGGEVKNKVAKPIFHFLSHIL